MSAVFSPCRTWRYRLDRVWDPALPRAAFILLNPSTADETKDDSTIRRCIAFAKDWGMGGLVLGNAFAFRSTDPFALREQPDPVGPENDRHLAEIAAGAKAVICGWGTHGVLHQRDRRVCEIITAAGAQPEALKRTFGGFPGHPLYLKRTALPFPYYHPAVGRTR